MRDEINAKIEDAVAYAESSPEPTHEDLFRISPSSAISSA